MGYEVKLTRPAVQDRESIVAYLLLELGSRQAAEGFLSRFDERVEQIATYPESCPLCRVESLARRGYRVGLVGDYLFIYSVEKSAHVVTFLRVFHGLQDYARLL